MGQHAEDDAEEHDAHARDEQVMALGPAASEQGAIDVGHERRGQGAERRIDRGQHDGAEHQPPQRVRHHLLDEVRQDLVGARHG